MAQEFFYGTIDLIAGEIGDRRQVKRYILSLSLENNFHPSIYLFFKT
jgi:hypothetical protein